MRGVFQRRARGQRVGYRTHAAYALHDLRGVQRIAAEKYGFKTAEHAPGEPGVLHDAVGHVQPGLEMSFDAGDGING